MCVCSVLAPHGCPEPPAPATRLSHHQSQPHDHPRRDARASVRLSLKSAPTAQAPAHFLRHHAAPERDAPDKTQLHREARAAARRARRPPRTRPATRPELLHNLLQAVQQPCQSSARVLRTAPLPPRARHDADPAPHEARAWHAARALRHPFSLLSSLPAHTAQHTATGKVHVHAAQSKHSSAAALRATSLASRRARACRTRLFVVPSPAYLY